MIEINWPRMPSLTALRAFEAAARLESFSAAARALNVTHAAVAQQVRALEDDLNTALVYREGRGIALTPEGAQLAQGLGEGFLTLQEAVSSLRTDRARQPLRISVTPVFAAQWLMPRLGDFWKKHPDVPISIEPDRRVVDLKRDGFDLAIRGGSGDDPGYDREFLIGARYVIVAAPTLMQGRTQLSAADMASMPWIMEKNWPDPMAWLRSLGLTPEALDITYVANEAMAIAGAKQGYGLYAGPQTFAEPDIASGQLIEVCGAGDEGVTTHYPYSLITRPGPRSEALKTFVRWLKAAV